MRILVFTEGTIIMHRGAAGHARDEIVRQVEENEESVHDFASYFPIGNAVRKLASWERGGAEILYLTSRRKHEEIESIRDVLKECGFPASGTIIPGRFTARLPPQFLQSGRPIGSPGRSPPRIR